MAQPLPAFFNRPLLIVEGIDGAGKSALIESFIKQHPDKFHLVPRNNQKSVSDEDTIDNFINYYCNLINLARQLNKTLLIDRSPLTGLIYNLYRGLDVSAELEWMIWAKNNLIDCKLANLLIIIRDETLPAFNDERYWKNEADITIEQAYSINNGYKRLSIILDSYVMKAARGLVPL